jgi:hypothetical protein
MMILGPKRRAARQQTSQNTIDHVSTENSTETESAIGGSKRMLIGWGVGCLLALIVIVPTEFARYQTFAENDIPWLFSMDIDTTPFALLFIALPGFWFAPAVRAGRFWKTCLLWFGESPGSENNHAGSIRRAWILALAVGAVALLNCWRVSSSVVHPDVNVTFGNLPPALHDEYSYEFQARTLLDGRLSYESHPTAARLFDQYHVINEGRFASRYFPGTGIWLAPFVAIDHAHWAQWLATVLICMFVFGIGRELSCNGVGLLAGVLVGCSPGMILFGNLLLAHQPTLVGLGLFLFCFFRMIRCLASEKPTSRSLILLASFSGCGLTFAMLCRPMSAAGVALPFGIWIAWWLFKNIRDRQSSKGVDPSQWGMSWSIIGGFGIPLAIGFGVLLVHNSNTTSDAFRTPYQLYTDIYTPRHAYGFNNAVDAKSIAPDRVLENYNNWAENLDAERAIDNVYQRLKASTQWTVGLIVVLISVVVFVAGVCCKRRSLDLTNEGSTNSPTCALDQRWWLILASVISLHVAHIPYWYDGILHWHYVFESGILLCLIVAAASLMLVRLARSLDRPWLQLWWASVLLVSLFVNLFDCSPFWEARLSGGVAQFGFAKLKHYVVEQIVEQRINEPAIVLVRHDPADRHNDYVNNDPALSNTILFARLPAATMTEEATIKLARAAFPERRLFVFDVVTNSLRAIE